MDLKLLDLGILNNSNLDFSKTYLDRESKELTLLVRNKVTYAIGIDKAAFEPFKLSVEKDEDGINDIQLNTSFQ